MDNSLVKFHEKIPANKFYPPRINRQHCLLRTRLLNHLTGKGNNPKTLILEAQAGQGKTTLAIQFLDYRRSPYSWYQIGTEDHDPLFFLTAILINLKRVLDGFRCTLLEKMIADGEISLAELPRLTNTLLNALDNHLDDDFYLVFDDLHLLEGHEESLTLLNLIVDTAPPKLNFILISRRPITLNNHDLKYGSSALKIDNQALALSVSETSELLNDVLQIPIDPATIRKLHQATHGWIMGMALAGRSLKQQELNGEQEAKKWTKLENKDILGYFEEEIFTQLPAKITSNLLPLALLDDIPVELAAEITNDKEIAPQLLFLQKMNFFVRAKDDDNKTFGIHHLFQEFLQERARKELTGENIKTIFQTAASFCLAHKRNTDALQYYLKADDYDAMGEMLKRDGMHFLAENRAITLSTILSQVPTKSFKDNGWLALFAGITQMEIAPKKSIRLLELAKNTFVNEREKRGELLTLSQIIYYHFLSSTLFNKGAEHLPKAEDIFSKIQDTLTPYEQILVAKNLACGFLFFEFSVNKSSQYSSLAMDLAKKYKFKSFIPSILTARGYELHLRGRQQQNKKNLEKAEQLINDQSIGIFNKMLLRTQQVNDLGNYGDFENYFHQKTRLISPPSKEIRKQTLLWTTIDIWRLEVLTALGKLSEAKKFYNEKRRYQETTPHLQSQLLHNYALIMALLGQRAKALKAAEESQRLRAKTGGPYYQMKGNIYIGATLGQLEMYKEADTLLTDTIEQTIKLDIKTLTAAGFLQRAYVRLQTNNHKGAQQDLASGLKVMRENDYVNFLSWTPSIMKVVLRTAVQENIEPEYAKKLARERLQIAILPDGSSLPILAIRVLGDFSLSIDNKTILKTEDLTPAQRQVMALLLASPSLRLSQEKIQLALWPNSPPPKARANFDTLLRRLRTALTKAIKPYPLKHYLKLKKGILCLENCGIDGVEFVHHAKKGIKHANRDEWWQAGNRFYSATQLWNGCFATDIFGDDEVQNYCMELRKLFAEISSRWANHLAGNNRRDDAIKIIKTALPFDNTNNELYRALHKFHLDDNDQIKAHKLLLQYKNVLKKMELPAGEIDSALNSITGLIDN